MSYSFFRTLTDNGEYKYFNTVFHFRYPGFEFIPVANDQILFVIFSAGLICSILLALGLHYRWASKGVFIIYLYTFLIDQAYFNNHYYFYALISMLLIFVPTNLHFSLDRLKGRVSAVTEHRWMILLFQLQVCIVYFYGGISKLSNPEWVSGLATLGLYGNKVAEMQWDMAPEQIQMVATMVLYGGIVFDLVVPFALMSRVKWIKWTGVVFALGFNISNAFTFTIGTFPYSMMAALLLFVWPTQPVKSKGLASEVAPRFVVRSFLSIYFLFQLIFPFRHLLVEGNVFWTGEHKMWSWHMMSGTTDIKSMFYLEEHSDDGELLGSHELDPRNFLNISQYRNLGKYPYCIPQFARFIKKEAELSGMQNVRVYGNIVVSRNHKEPRFIVSPRQELSSLRYNSWLQHNDWILLYKAEEY